MANVYIEPKPTGRSEGDAIDHVDRASKAPKKAAHTKHKGKRLTPPDVRVTTPALLASE